MSYPWYRYRSRHGGVRIAGGGGRIAAGGGLFAGGGGLFAGGPFAAGLIAGGPFASGLNAAHQPPHTPPPSTPPPPPTQSPLTRGHLPCGDTFAWSQGCPYKTGTTVPQGSVLGPILFLIYINDLEKEIGSNILKFADDTKMFRRVESQEDRHQLQSDLNKLVKWAEKWQMLFNKDKCKCLHIGQANAKNNYLMNNTVLLSTEREKDLGVVVSSDMKVSEQCGIAARKGNQILGLIRRNIAYRDKRLIIPLYMSLVRPHLEYCIQAWRPHMRKDIDKLERVQRRANIGN